MIDVVTIADEGIGEAAEIEQAIPVSVVACETGDFEAEHDTDVTEGDFGGELGKAISLSDTSSREPEIFIDTTICCDGHPKFVALETKAYCCCVDSRLCATW
jgi:hypothetical protein